MKHVTTSLSDSSMPLTGNTDPDSLRSDNQPQPARLSGYPQPVTNLFEDQVIRQPDAIAAVFNNQHLTYRILNARGNQLAHYLMRHGVGPETRVGICFDRSLELLISMLGIIKAGGAYVPVDPGLPSQRMAFILEDSSTSILLTQKHLMNLPPNHKITSICLDKDWEHIAGENPENPIKSSHWESLAYVIYTSGSTGQPKGVGISHRALSHFLTAFQAEIAIRTVDRLLSGTTITFDMAVPEIWLPLVTGAQVCVAPKALTQDGKQLARLIDETNSSVMQGTPATWQMLFESGWTGNSLQKIVCGGDILSPGLARKLLGSGSEAWNCYGPTETTVWSTAAPLEAEIESVSIGTPLANTELFILDECGSHLPIGTTGELYIGGTSLARGYIKRPALTAEKFVPNPWSREIGRRLYRTGDLVRSVDGGGLEFQGRTDHQVKVRGFRIELGEVETALCRHPAVRQTVVMTQKDSPEDIQLTAYLMLEPESKTTPGDLRRSLQHYLPDYMIPGLFVPVETFPLTPHGKIDRKSLSVLQAGSLMRTEEFVAPRTHVETTLERIWSEVLHALHPGVYDNFFELGGHSLLAIKIISRVRKRFNLEFPIIELFTNPTIAAMADFIGKSGEEHSVSAVPPIKPASRRAPLPLSYAQERVWFIQQLDSHCQAYHFQCAIRFKGHVDIPSVEKCLNTITHRHEIYRTTFSNVEGSVIQTVHPFQPFNLPVISSEASSEAEQERFVREKIREELDKPFVLHKLPLIRWTVLKLGELDHILLHIEHHLLHDGCSFHIFLREFLELYGAFTSGRPASLPELPIQFVDFAQWERQQVETGFLQPQIDYWKEQLSGSPSLVALPYDFPRSPVQTFKGAAPRVVLPPHLSKAVRQFSRQEKTTLFITMFTAFAGMMYRLTGQDDLCIGTAIANRRLRECEDVIGMFVNNVVLRIKNLRGEVSGRELLEHIRVITQEAYAHQDIPFDHVVKALQPERDPGRNPLFQTAFSFHDSPLPNIQIPDLNVSVLEILSNHTAKFDLNVIVLPWSNVDYTPIPNTEDEGITVIWEYNTDLFAPETIDQMLNSYQVFLDKMLADPDHAISTLPLLTDRQVSQQVVEWNHTERDFPRDDTLPRMLAHQVECSPDAVAVVCEDCHVTYGQLHRRANQLSHVLRRRGIGPEVRVGVCLEQGVEWIITLLAIMKTGGAYVPLDPATPIDRISKMLDDAGVPLILTHSSRLAQQLAADVSVLLWEELSLQLDKEPSQTPTLPLHPLNLAYVIYTSGSTGFPKGVEISHAGLLNLVTWHQTEFQLTPRDRTSLLAGVAFDAAGWELWPSLATGASVHIPENETIRFNAAALQEWLLTKEITIGFLPTPMAEQVLAISWPTSSGLRIMLTGGDTLRHFPHPGVPFELVNNYGPTETTVVTTSVKLKKISHSPHLPPIGRPISNNQVFNLDTDMQLTPLGIPGEVYIGGEGLARGYTHLPGLTAERFLPNPFSLQTGSRLYRTGDLVRLLPDGNLKFSGRNDRQLKIRGHRIEPGEIEAVLLRHPKVRKAVVLYRENCSDDKKLVAYIAGDDKDRAKPDLRAYLKKYLLNYMIPPTFVFLETLPLTPTGKLDRHALPLPEHVDRDEERPLGVPRTLIETLLVQVWREVLKTEEIGIQDNFFHLGGHSLLATRIMSRLQNSLQISLPLRLFFEFPVLEDLAKEIEGLLEKPLPDNDEDYPQLSMPNHP